MSFNNGFERKKFESAWKKLRVEYAAAGMDEASIEEMYQFDLDTFNSERRYAEHTQGMPYQQFEDDGDIASDDKSALLVKFFDSMAVMPRDTDEDRRDGWLDEIENPEVLKALREFSQTDIEVLTLLVFEGFSEVEIAEIQGVTKSAICHRLARLKKILKKFC